MHLASQAWFTNGIWIRRGVKFESSHHFLLNHLLDICKITMAKTSMPERHVKRECRQELGRLHNSFCGTIKKCSIAIIDGSSKALDSIVEEMESSRVNMNGITAMTCQVKHRQKVVSKFGNMHNTREFHSFSLSPLNHRSKLYLNLHLQSKR